MIRLTTGCTMTARGLSSTSRRHSSAMGVRATVTQTGIHGRRPHQAIDGSYQWSAGGAVGGDGGRQRRTPRGGPLSRGPS